MVEDNVTHISLKNLLNVESSDEKEENPRYRLLEPMKSNLKRCQLFRKNLEKKTEFVKEVDLDTEYEKDGPDPNEGIVRHAEFEEIGKNPSTIEKRTYNPPSEHVAISFIPNDEIGKGRSKFYSLQGGKGVQAVCDTNPEYDPLQYRTSFSLC